MESGEMFVVGLLFGFVIGVTISVVVTNKPLLMKDGFVTGVVFNDRIYRCEEQK